MDGRQYFPGNYGGNYQQASDFNAASYPHVYQGMLGNYFAPGPHTATTQQLGGPAPSTHMQFANQAAEDPALFVTFEEEDEDFPSTSRAAIARNQPMPFRRQPSQNAVGTQAANNRQQPPGGTVPQAPNRASSAGPVKILSSAEQELEDLKRRIADKERQMKAKRQTGQGYSGVPTRSRPNPAHGPVLRGLHRKQPPMDAAAVSTQEADLFLKQVAAELPASRGTALVQKTAAASKPVTKPASKAAILSQKSQLTAHVVKKATAIAPAQAATATAQSGRAVPSVSAAKQQAVPEPAKAQQQETTKPAVTRSGPKVQEAASASQSQTHAVKTLPAVKQPAAAQTSRPAQKSQAAQEKPTASQVQAGTAASKSVAPGNKPAVSSAGKQSEASEQQPLAAPKSHLPAANPVESGKASPAGLSLADDWSDEGMPVQSGYHMSDSPLPDEEEPLPSVEAPQEPVQEVSRAPYIFTAKMAKEATMHEPLSNVSRPLQPQAPKAVPPGSCSTATDSAQQRRAPTASHTMVPSPYAAKPAAVAAPSTADNISAGSKPTSIKQPAAAAAVTTTQTDGSQVVIELSAAKASVADAQVAQPAQPIAGLSHLSVSSSTGQAKPAAASAQVPSDAVRASPEGQAATPSGSKQRLVVRKQHARPSEPVIPAANRQAAVPEGQPSATHAHTPSPKRDRREAHFPASPAKTQPLSRPFKPFGANQTPVGKPSKAAAASKPSLSSWPSISPKPRPVQHSGTNGLATMAHAAASTSQQDQSKAAGKPAAATVKPSAPRQSSAALSGKASASKAPAAASREAPLTRESPATQAQGAPAVRAGLKAAAVESSSARTDGLVPTMTLSANTASQESLPQPPLPASPPPPPHKQGLPFPESQAAPAVPPIPGLASPEGPAVLQPAPPVPMSHPAITSIPSMPAQVSHAIPQAPPLPLPTTSLSQPFLVSSGLLPPEPSSPRPSPVVSPRKQGTSAAPTQQRGPLLATDSGEDMEIDGEAGKEVLPPLPTGPFPSGLELAMIDSSTQDVMDISAEDRDSLLDELSGINARTDELRVQKRFLNDMFARVKQEYLERRLRQQQIEQMLGHKGNLVALPSTLAEEAGPSNALALRPTNSSALGDQADASPGDHLQARKAELQSRAELHKARLDALNAKQRSTPSSAKPAALQPGVSPMTHKAIVDLTASPVALKQTTAPAAAAQTTAAAAAAPIPAATALPPALPVAAVSKPLTASQLERLTAADTTSAATAAPKPSTAIADKTEAVKLPTAKPATATISKDSKQRAQPAASQSTAARRLDKPASSKGAAGRSPTTSRQALKRRRSRSQSPAQRTGAGPRAGKTQPGGQRQAVTSSHRRPTRSRSRSPLAKKGRHQQAQPRGRRHSSSTSASSSPGRRSPHSSSSSLSPVRRTLRQPRRSPSRSRHRGRRSPSPKARPRSARSLRAKGRSQRSPSPLAKNRRGSSPSRRPQRRAGGSGRSPARHDRQRKPAQAGGSTTPSTSRSPSPVRRRAPPGNPLPSRAGDRHQPRDSPQKAVMRRSSPVQQANTGQDRTAPSRKSQDIASLAVEPTTKPHHGSAPPAVPTAAAAADTNGQLPPPPDRAHAAQGPALPPAPVLPLPPPPQQEQRVQAVSPEPVQAPKYAVAQALVEPKKRLVPAQQRSASVASGPPPSAAAAAAAAQRDVNLLYVIEDREPLPQRLPSKSSELPAGHLTKTVTAPTPSTLPSDTAVRPAAARDSTAADAGNNKPSQSFDGKQSFISLDLEEAPVTGPSSVEQPSSAAAKAAPKADAQGDAVRKARPEKQPTQQAEPMDLDSANPSASAADLPALSRAQLLGTAPTPATSAGKPAAAEADARAIRPDLFADPSQSRPVSAASQGLAAAEFSEAETGQKLLAASRSKAAGKGNIQIVLATKHKQEVAKGGFPFPTMFNALAAQGLPSQSAASERELLPLPLPQPAAVTDTSGHKYDSPLRVFRSYRLCDTFQTVSQLPLASPSFTHRLDPHWPLCTYDIRGSCRDAKCQYQHASDYQLENVAVLRDLHSQAVRAGSRAALPTLPGGEITAIMMTALTQQAIRAVPSPHIILPSPSGASPAPSPVKPRPQLRIPRDRRRQLASEASLPLYTPFPSGPLATQSHPFSSQLLSSAQTERQGVMWQLLPGWEGYDSLHEGGAAINTVSLHDHAARPAAAVSKPGDKMTGRYYQVATQDNPDSPAAAAAVEAAAAAVEAAAAAAGNAAPELKVVEGPEPANNQRKAVLKELEEQTVADPGNQDVWLQYALEQIDYAAVDSMHGQKLMACLRCISKGLEADPCFTWLWLLYLPLYCRHMTAKGGPSDVTKVAETSLTHSKHCYQLWLRVVQLQPDWQRRAALLQRGVLALAQAQPGDYAGVSEEEAAGWATMRSACVLDLVLRLLLLWTSVEAHDVVAGWIAELVKLVDQAKARVQSEDDALQIAEHALGGAARQALLQQLQDHPVNAAVLWLTCAHLAAYNTLPSQVIHRLGFVQQPLVLSWQQAPPASTHSRVRSILITAASAGLGCLDLKTKCQVVDGESIHRAVAAAHPRQALALTIAHWELTTNTTSLLGSLSATLGQHSIPPTAGSLLMLASLTSKAACTVAQPLPDQAMDTWQHATWPTGDTELLCMALVLAADQRLQSFADSFADSFGKNGNQSADSKPGRLQQAVSAAAALLTQLALCASEALGLTADDDDEEEGKPQARFQGLHPAVVGAMATRVFQLSSGLIQAAMALLVASVLPEWELDLLRAEHAGTGPAADGPAAVGPPDRAFSDAEQGQSPSMREKRARSYRKRRRSPSRSLSPGKAPPQNARSCSTKRRRSRSLSSSSTSGSSSSYSASGSSSRSSGSSSGSGTSSSSTSSGSSHDDRMRSRPDQQQYADAISDGLQSEQSLDEPPWIDWAAVEAGGSLGGLDLVRQGFWELSKPAEPVRGSPDFEEGEIRAVDLNMKRNHAAHWSLNLAVYEALQGQAPRALQALQAAQKTAEGSLHLQQDVWREVLEFASAALPSSAEPDLLAASSPADADVKALLGSQYPVGLRQKLHLLQQFQAWQCEQAVLKPLALPILHIKDKKARALLEQPQFQDGESMKDAALAMLAHVPPTQEVFLIEALVSAVPAAGAKAQLLLDLAASKPQDGQHASWMLPLAANALLNAAPPAAPHLWLQAVVLAEKHSVAAARELSVVAVARHPHSKALARRHSALHSPSKGPAVPIVTGASKATAQL